MDYGPIVCIVQTAIANLACELSMNGDFAVINNTFVLHCGIKKICEMDLHGAE